MKKQTDRELAIQLLMVGEFLHEMAEESHREDHADDLMTDCPPSRCHTCKALLEYDALLANARKQLNP